MDNHYDVLGLGLLALPDEVREAHRRLAKVFHPDRHAAGNPVVAAHAQQVMARINEAYAVLDDPDRRQDYDRWLSGDPGPAGCAWPRSACACWSRPRVVHPG